jgi:hypothetical protein
MLRVLTGCCRASDTRLARHKVVHKACLSRLHTTHTSAVLASQSTQPSITRSRGLWTLTLACPAHQKDARNVRLVTDYVHTTDLDDAAPAAGYVTTTGANSRSGGAPTAGLIGRCWVLVPNSQCHSTIDIIEAEVTALCIRRGADLEHPPALVSRDVRVGVPRPVQILLHCNAHKPTPLSPPEG